MEEIYYNRTDLMATAVVNLPSSEIDIEWIMDHTAPARVREDRCATWTDGEHSFGAPRGMFRVCGFCNMCYPVTSMVPQMYWQYCPNCGSKMVVR